MRNLFFKSTALNLLLFAAALVFTAYSSVKSDSELKAYLDRTHEIRLMKPDFESASYKELLTFEYEDKKESLIILADFDKDRLKISGLSTGYVNLFTLVYTQKELTAEAKIPLKFLPPVNQVLLDILLCQSKAQDIIENLPSGYTLSEDLQSGLDRNLYNTDNDLIYKIEYRKIKDKILPVTVYNYTFDYTIRIKYL